MKEIGKAFGNLYKLTVPELSTLKSHVADSSPKAVLQTISVDTNHLWHSRFGHPPVHILQKLHDISPIKNATNTRFFCDVCHLAKQSRLPFPISESKAEKLFDTIHCDVWGLYRHKTYSTCNAFLTIVDDFSRITWTYLLSNNSQVPSLIKYFCAYVNNHFNTSVKTVRTDNGSEFFNSEINTFFSENGIGHQHSCIETAQQNERAERKHRHLLSVARALKYQSHVPNGEIVYLQPHTLSIELLLLC